MVFKLAPPASPARGGLMGGWASEQGKPPAENLEARSMLAVLVAATVLTVATNSMVTVLLPDIGRSLVAGPVALGWTATGALEQIARRVAQETAAGR
ncbi:hypothetical protein [Pseudonocardia sp. T1-2H]|uniref:hypothetical protein n=1 Tax=Pseudonocardia sp. T1-2H TaxID=3128899 RepID=UPI003101325F